MGNNSVCKNLLNCSSLVDILNDRAIYQPNQLAYTFLVDGATKEVSLTYQELDLRSQAIAANLQSLCASGERALLLYPSSLEFITAFFGCLYAGVIAVPAYPPKPNQKMPRLLSIVASCQPKVALTTKEQLVNIESSFVENPQLKEVTWIATDNINIEDAAPRDFVAISSDTCAFLQYTSGSTGMPKGVMVSHGNLLHNSEYIKTAFELTSDSISVSWLPFFHDMGLIDGIIQPLYTGFLGVLMSPVSFLKQPIRWLSAISRYKATHSGGPNFGYNLCTSKITPEQRSRLDLSNWCSAYSGAEPVRQETLEQFASHFADCGFRASFFYPCYGMAEATLMITGGEVLNEPVYCQVDAKALEENRVAQATASTQKTRNLVGCGHTWLNSKVVIVHPETLKPCDSNQVGEIWVSSPSVASGYWNQPEETSRTFQAQLQNTGEGPFLRTGDLGFFKDGELFITGRLKDVIIIRGGNHYPQDIELTVEKSHPALRRPSCGAAFAVDINGEEQLVIVQEVERSYLPNLDVNQVIENIREAVGEEHDLQPYAVLLLKSASIPKTSSGKIQRHACRTHFLNGSLSVISDWYKNPQSKTNFRRQEGEVESLPGLIMPTSKC